MSYGVKPIIATGQCRYLIKYQGEWVFVDSWSRDPDWEDTVTDVISYPHEMSYDDHRWRKKNGRRYLLRDPEIVKDDELTMILLQVKGHV